jgi:hypothetical protein
VISLTITRAALSLADLTIGDNPFAGDHHLPEGGLSWPQFTMRRAYFPDSDFVDGSLLSSAVKGMGTHALSIYAHGDTTAELFAAMDVLEAAFTIDGVSRTYAADPEFPQWGEVDSGMVRAHMARATVTVPLHPGAI